MNTALNRTGIVFLTNESGGDVAQGDVVIVDDANAGSFTTTTTAGFSDSQVGVVLDVNGIANNATGAVAFSGWVPVINLDGAATLGDFVKTDTVAGQGTPHAAPQEEGDFAQVLAASATPAAILFGSPNPPFGNVTAGGTLTSNALVIGQGSQAVAVTTTGTGVLTALGINIGSAGAINAWELIEEATPSGVGTITFSSLGTFTHLEIRYSARSSKAASNEDLNIRFNGDTGNNYDTQILNSFGSTTASGEGVPLAFFGGIGISASSATAGACGVGTISIYDYRGTTFFKSITANALRKDSTASAGNIAQVMAGAWRNTAAVTSITLLLQSGNFDAGSKFSLYGIR